MILEGKVAIVTGGGSGLGAEIAKRFAEEGAKVVITGRREAYLERAAATMPEGMVKCCAADITKQEDCERVIETALSFGGGIHILVNNAGRADNSTPLADFPVEELRSIIDINLIAPFVMMKLSIPHMIEAGSGSIINISSLAGLGIIPGSSGYCSTKRAIIALTEVAAVDYGAQNIRANVICPGSFMTEMTEHGLSDLSGGGDRTLAAEAFSAPVPQKRIADPSEIAGICAFLASDDASYISGATIPVDGGVHVVDPQAFSISQMKR